MAIESTQLDLKGLPTDWDIRFLKDVAEVRSGIAKNSSLTRTDPIRVHYLRVANVQDGYLDLSEMSTIEIRRGDLNRFSVLPGDVLMNEGGDLDQLGRGAVWRGQYQPCVHQNHVFVVRCGEDLSPDFLNTWTSSAIARRYFMYAGKQTTNLASINKTAIGELPVAVPKPREQRAIAAALSDVDEFIGALDKLIAKKRAIKLATMQQLLTGKTRLPGFSGEWNTFSLGDIADLHRHNSVPAASPNQVFFHFSLPAFDDGCVPVREPGALIHSNKFVVPQDAILLSKLNPRIPRVWAPDMIPPNSVASTEFLVLTANEQVDRNFLFVACSSRNFRGQMELAATGTTGSHQRISPAGALKLLIRMPLELSEQEAIASILRDMDAEIAALEQRRDKTKAIKKGMMQSLLTGRVRLVDPEGTP